MRGNLDIFSCKMTAFVAQRTLAAARWPAYIHRKQADSRLPGSGQNAFGVLAYNIA